MTELTFEYWNKLADQTITISSLLGGFSIAVIANFLVSETNTRLKNNIMAASTLAAGFFLITVFAMTKLLMMTTDGYPIKVVDSDLIFPRVIGVIAFLCGIISLITMISMSGWTKSKRMGILTTTIGILTFLLILLMLT
jgi:cytochrome bd-type quinol oxidase subunit 2